MALKKKKTSKKISSSRSTTHREVLEEIIRVDHAGERGAIKIYEGQLLALKTFKQNEYLKKKIEEMKEHEREHYEYFDNEIKNDPNDYEAIILRGICYEKVSNFKKAYFDMKYANQLQNKKESTSSFLKDNIKLYTQGK